MEREKAIHPGVLKAVSARMFPDETYVDVASLLKHFGDPTRVTASRAGEKRDVCQRSGVITGHYEIGCVASIDGAEVVETGKGTSRWTGRLLLSG